MDDLPNNDRYEYGEYCPLHQTHDEDIKDIRADISKLFLRYDMNKDSIVDSTQKIMIDIEKKVDMNTFKWIIGIVGGLLILMITGSYAYTTLSYSNAKAENVKYNNRIEKIEGHYLNIEKSLTSIEKNIESNRMSLEGKKK